MSEQSASPVESSEKIELSGDVTIKEQPDTNKSDATIQLGELIDVIGKLRVVLTRQINLSFTSSSVPLEALSSRCEIRMFEIPSVESQFNVWVDVPNNERYVINQVQPGLSFSNADEYLSAILMDLESEVKKSSTYILEPSRVNTIGAGRNYPPQSLGIPLEFFHLAGVLDDNARHAIAELCSEQNVYQRVSSFVLTNTFEYGPRAVCRDALMAYAQRNGPANATLMQNVIACANSTFRKQIVNLKKIDEFTTLYPFPLYNMASAPFDDFPRGGYSLRYETVGTLSGFDIRLDPISSADLFKSSNTSVTKIGYLNDLATTTFDEGMGVEISALMMSYVLPREILLEIDLSDIRADQVDLRGITGLLCMGLFMYDEGGSFCNLTRNSMITIQNAIVEYGSSKQALRRIEPPAREPFALSNYSYANNPNNTSLRYLQVIHGMSGLNCSRRDLANDEMMTCYPDCSRRMNYAINYANYLDYSRDVLDTSQWPIAAAVRDFVSKCVGGNSLLPYFQAIFSRLQNFFVCLNQHLSVYWYNTFRNSNATQALRNISSEGKAIVATIRGKTILHLARSLTGHPLTPKHSILDRLKIECGLAIEIIEFASRLRAVNANIEDLGLDTEYSLPKRLKLIARSGSFMQYVVETLAQVEELPLLTDAVLLRFVDDEFMQCFSSLAARTRRDFLVKGTLPNFISQIQCNVLNEMSIGRLIDDRSIYINSAPVEGKRVVTNDILRSLITHKSFKSVLFNSGTRPLLFEFPLPFKISHALPLNDAEHLISSTDDDSVVAIRTRVKVREFSLNLVSFDLRNYVYADQYTPHPVTIQTSYAVNSDVGAILTKFDDFIASLGQHANPIQMMCEKVFHFESVFTTAT